MTPQPTRGYERQDRWLHRSRTVKCTQMRKGSGPRLISSMGGDCERAALQGTTSEELIPFDAVATAISP